MFDDLGNFKHFEPCYKSELSREADFYYLSIFLTFFETLERCKKLARARHATLNGDADHHVRDSTRLYVVRITPFLSKI